MKKTQRIQRMILYIVEFFANVKHFTFFLGGGVWFFCINLSSEGLDI